MADGLQSLMHTVRGKHRGLFVVEAHGRSWRGSRFVVFVGSPIILLGTRGHRWAVMTALAHELGHYLSWQAGTFEPGPDEERRAWRLGFAECRRVGLPPTPAMRRMRDSLLRRRCRQLAREAA